ncbi:hypothetical protein [Capillimicrobium parvum]|uniref:hypothetical protein n=1 Tax=Capillimicrobium parvum TaxID=2884022 RepID=UPI0038991B0F
MEAATSSARASARRRACENNELALEELRLLAESMIEIVRRTSRKIGLLMDATDLYHQLCVALGTRRRRHLASLDRVVRRRAADRLDREANPCGHR